MGIEFKARCLLIALLTGAGASDRPAQMVYEVEPGQDYRPVLHRLHPGNELVLLPGVHEQYASFRLEGTAARPIIIRGQRDAAGNLPALCQRKPGLATTPSPAPPFVSRSPLALCQWKPGLNAANANFLLSLLSLHSLNAVTFFNALPNLL